MYIIGNDVIMHFDDKKIVDTDSLLGIFVIK